MGAVVSCIGMYLCECACCFAFSCCQGLIDATFAVFVRLGHLLVMVFTFILAIVLGNYYHSRSLDRFRAVADFKLGQTCNDSDSELCITRQLIYRASLSLFILYATLGIFSTCFKYFDNGLWMLKFMLAFGMLIGFCWVEDSVFTGFSELSRVVGMLWLLAQSILLLDLAHDVHDVIIDKADKANNDNTIINSRFWYISYLIVCISCLCAVVTGLVYLFSYYVGCHLGMFFVILTLIFGVITTILSLLESVNKGLLTPTVMFAYSTFTCWYALLSSPDDTCNPFAGDKTLMDASMVIISVVSLIILLYCVFRGSTILNIFNPEASGVIAESEPCQRASSTINDSFGATRGDLRDERMERAPLSPAAEVLRADRDSGTAHERVFFHILMTMASCYAAMVLTNWASPDGSRSSELAIRVANESMWLKITSQWVFLLLYLRALYVIYYDQQH